MPEKVIRIGGASGFWGESPMATPQLLRGGGLDYIVFDYLAEITMSIMARARSKDPALGYATDFIAHVLKPNLGEIARQGVKLISNAGGVNPTACGRAAREAIAEAGLDLKVAVVTGDDLLPRADELAGGGYREMFSNEPFPERSSIASINAYLGAFPIAAALAEGADIVITGRSVDSAVTLGACIHEFGWARDDWDRLAGGSLAGHILECGPQATGGNFTDWELVADTISDIGYPIAEISADGTFVCTKPAATGGIVTVGTVSEQMLYEIGDPQAYFLPDVVCDFSAVSLVQAGEDRVVVSGAKGRPAPDTYKVCATYADGYRGGVVLSFYGIDADRKARCFATAALERAGRLLETLGLPAYTETSVEVIGAESQYGDRRRIEGAREVALKLAAKHADALGIGVLLKEMTGLALATPPGLSGFAGSRPRPSPLVRLFSFLIPKTEVEIVLEHEGATATQPAETGEPFDAATIERPEAPATPGVSAARNAAVDVPLVQLAWGRSGDKGNKSNIGIIARRPEYLPYIWRALDEETVAACFAHFLEGGGERAGSGAVERYLLPGSSAVNFVLHDVLGGGGVASLRNDPQGKGYAQLLLDHPVAVPPEIAESVS
ncbi:MAG: acyclic terpene utilization AtuA family protein [Candidatus Binatia bacterium]